MIETVVIDQEQNGDRENEEQHIMEASPSQAHIPVSSEQLNSQVERCSLAEHVNMVHVEQSVTQSPGVRSASPDNDEQRGT